LLLEHEPTVTLGYRTGPSQGLLRPEELARRGIGVVATERGGAATYHGPGQLVAYPIFFLPAWGLGVKDFIWRLEEVAIRVARAHGVRAQRSAVQRGVWVGGKKIGAVGVAVRGRASLHGLALNVSVDLGPFSYIVPCALPGLGVTSLREQTGREPELAAVARQVAKAFAEVFGATLWPAVGPEAEAVGDRRSVLGAEPRRTSGLGGVLLGRQV
jgi:lipoyl(octanoyl) transferase